MFVATSERNAPPSPAQPPEMMTARYFIRYTGTPSDSAACGCSPQARTRRPNFVRHSAHQDSGISANATRVSSETWVTSPPRTPATSETANQPLRSSVRSHGDSPGTVTVLIGGSDGDWVTPPPGVFVNTSADRYRVMPAPRMLIATPETMWSTPNVTVASACSSPPSAPPSTPATTPHQAPNSYAPQAPNQVPRIIMPSSPMLTTPARSAHRPPSPASPIGTASRSAAPVV